MTLTTILFAIGFVTAVYSNPLSDGDSADLGPLMCFDGPKVWCQNFTVAAECKAVKHCIQTVWLNEKILHDDDSCTSCIDSVDKIRNNINSTFTKEMLENILDYTCELSIFTRIIRKECEDLINTYVDSHLNDLLDLIRSAVDARTVCRLLGLCWSESSLVSEVTSSPLSDAVNDDDAVVYFRNIVLHFPAKFQGLVNTNKKLFGANRCTWGPSYWCGNLTTSAECGSTKHCISKVWEKKQYDEDNDSVCQVCKDMVQQARDQLLSNETQEELKEVFEGSCKLIPLKEIQKECIRLADEFVPELTDVLASQMNPTAVCTIAGLCNSQRIDQMLLASAAAVSDPRMDSCVNCTVAFTAVGRYLRDSPKSDVLGKLLTVCGELSSYSDACSALVQANFNNLYSMMTSQMNPLSACHLSGMCAYKFHMHSQPEDVVFQQKVNTMLAVPNDDLPCDLCKQLVTHFKEILIANTTEEEFLEVLKGMCEQTGSFKDECLELVQDNFKVIYQFLTEELDPVKVCTEVNLCPRGQNSVSDDKLGLISGRVVPVITSNEKFTNLMPVIKRKETGNIECSFCKSVIHLVQQEMKNPEYEKDIEKAVREVCHLVPSSDVKKCNEFIDEYADMLIKMLADETDPAAICALLDLCLEESLAVKNNEVCALCQYILHFIQEALEDPTDVSQIEKVVEKVCRLIPDSMAPKCDEFISEYSALIISILAEEVDPALVCPVLKLCPSLQAPEKRCEHCLTSMQKIIDQLGGNHEDVTHIKEVVKKFKPQNNMTMVDAELKFANYEDIVDMMTADFTADESCVYLDFCRPEDAEHLKKVSDVESNEISDWQPTVSKPSCEICELFVKLYEDKLTSNTTEEEIETLLVELCSKLKNPDLKSNCSRLVYKYVPVLAELLKDNVKPKELCTVAKFCPGYTSVGDRSQCNLCETVIGAVEGFLSDPMEEERAGHAVGKICSLFSNPNQYDTCKNIINQVFPQVEGIGLGIPGWFYCTKLKMCPYGDLVDYKACSVPSLVCRDVKTAFLCDKLDHCQLNVWESLKPSLN